MVMGIGEDNMAGVFFARKGYYKGQEVTITHRDPATGELWLEDYPTKGSGSLDYGMWVNADSVSYKGEQKHASNERGSKQTSKKARRKQNKPKANRE